MHPDAAGIDIGARHHYVSVPEDCGEETIRRFGCYTPELEEMAQWLKQCGVKTDVSILIHPGCIDLDTSSVVMESTGVYWIPVFRVLEDYGLEVLLVNPRHVKYVPGRKTDVADCQWLRQLHTYWRQRKELVESASREILHMQKALTRMNVQLHVALSDITGVSGMKILRAIVAGEHDPVQLAKLANSQVRSSRDEIAQALSGHYTPEELFVLKQALELFPVHPKRSKRTRRVFNRAADALRIAAQTLWHSKSYLGAYYRRFAARLDAPKAITATAHKLARIIYRALKYGHEYVDKGQQHLEKQHHERSMKSLATRAKELGYMLVNIETGECLGHANQGLTQCVS